MPARLTICYPDRPAIESILFENKGYRVGRSNECELVVQHPTVSREHAVVSFAGAQWKLNDSHSHNGTRVNGELVNDYQLNSDDLISVGSVDCLFQLQSQSQIDASIAHDNWRIKQSQINQSKLTKQSLLSGLNERLFSLLSLTGTERGIIMLGDEIEKLTVFAVNGMTSADFCESDFSGSIGAIKSVVENHQPLIAMDVLTESMLAKRESIKRKKIAALACIPLMKEQELIGVVYLDSKATNKILSQLDVEIMNIICGQLELATQALLMNEQIHQLLEQVTGYNQQDLKRYNLKHQARIINRTVLSLVN